MSDASTAPVGEEMVSVPPALARLDTQFEVPRSPFVSPMQVLPETDVSKKLVAYIVPLENTLPATERSDDWL